MCQSVRVGVGGNLASLVEGWGHGKLRVGNIVCLKPCCK